jgi:phage recombination protein Bet
MAHANTRTAKKTNPKPPATVGNPPNVPAKSQADWENKPVTFTALGESEPITLTPGMIRNQIATRSKCGNLPEYRDIAAFMMLCRQRRLNPFVGDAYLIGFDETVNGVTTTTWTLITAIQALRKRAEIHPQYDGGRHGIIVKNKDTQAIEEVEGAFRLDNQILLGGWAEGHRKDRSIPTRARLKFTTYDKGYSRWKVDPEGMISKCAEAAALREAFPSDVGGLYLSEEFDSHGRYVGDQSKVVDSAPRQLGDLTDQLKAAEAERDQSAIDAQDQMAVDQTGPEDDGAQAPPTEAPSNDDGPPQMSREEIEEHERLLAEHEARRDHGGQQGSLLDKGGEQYR